MPLSWKLIGIGIVLAAIGGLIWREHIVVQQRNKALAENLTLTATIAAKDQLIATIKDDQERANASATSLQGELKRIRDEPPIMGVSCRTTGKRVPAESRSAADPHGTTAEPLESLPAGDPEWRDVSSGADWYAGQCAEVVARLEALQEWERLRSH